MNSSTVVFGLNNERYPYIFDRSRLRLGATVYVKFNSANTPEDFYPDFKPSCIPYFVMWIAPSEWYVALENEFHVDNSFQERTIKAVESYLDKETVSKALSMASKDIRPEYMFKTSELDNSRLAVISTVVERLDLCSKLAQKTTAEQLFHHYRPLVIYLLLTCFDRLGQPADWLDFGSWLNSSGKKQERENVINREIEDEIEIALAYYNAYNRIYGVSSSFYRFLHEIIPTQTYHELLDSIRFEILDNPPDIGNDRSSDNSTKEKYLFNLRNDYTHKAKFVPGVTKDIWPEGVIGKDTWEAFQQSIEQSTWKTIFVKNWPEILEKVVRVGLAIYIKRITLR